MKLVATNRHYLLPRLNEWNCQIKIPKTNVEVYRATRHDYSNAK